MKNEILECPLCGGTAIWEEYKKFDGQISHKVGRIRCWKCSCQTREYDIEEYYGPAETKEDALAAWNRRV